MPRSDLPNLQALGLVVRPPAGPEQRQLRSSGLPYRLSYDERAPVSLDVPSHVRDLSLPNRHRIRAIANPAIYRRDGRRTLLPLEPSEWPHSRATSLLVRTSATLLYTVGESPSRPVPRFGLRPY